MIRPFVISMLTLAGVLLPEMLSGQQPFGFYRVAADNPSLAGAQGDLVMRLICASFYPGGGYKLNACALDINGYAEPLHGGAAFSMASSMAGGLMNDTRAMFAYSYHMRASKDLYIFAGMSAGMIWRTLITSKLIFPDQIDPLRGIVIPGGEQIDHPSIMIFDMSVGFTLSYLKSVLSIDAAHLFSPALSHAMSSDVRINRVFTLKAFTRMEPREGSFSLTPYTELAAGKDVLRGACGGSVGLGPAALAILYLKSKYDANIQVSVSVQSGEMGWFYGFRFRPSVPNDGLPFGSMHQIGLKMDLNIVDKRNTIITIKLPEL